MSKKSFWSRLFSGNEPQADVNGNMTFSGEQFATLTAHLDGWESALESAKEQAVEVENLKTAIANLAAATEANSAKMAKWATVPAAAPAATATEPQATTEPLEVDPLDAKLKAMHR